MGTTVDPVTMGKIKASGYAWSEIANQRHFGSSTPRWNEALEAWGSDRKPGQSLYRTTDGSIEVIEVDPEERWYEMQSKPTPGKAGYEFKKTQKTPSGWRLLVIIFRDGMEEMREMLGSPPWDGYLVMNVVLADTDRLIPIGGEWVGKALERHEADDKIDRALGAIRSIGVDVKVPAPSLPGYLLDLIDEARAGGMSTWRRDELTNELVALDRIEFLEAMDRLLPWISGQSSDRGEATASWIDKNDKIADKLWTIKRENPKLVTRMRLAPWKTGLGNPTMQNIDVRAVIQTQDSTRANWIQRSRRPTGGY